MNIVIIAALLPQANKKCGGVDSTVHKLANELAKNKSDTVTVFSLNQCPSDGNYKHKQLFSNLPWAQNSKIFRLLIFPFLLNFMDFSEFDVVHLHGDDWFFFHRIIPSVRTLHGSALNEARFATSLKRKLVQSVIYPLEHLSTWLATIPLAVGSDSQKIYNIETRIENGISSQLFYPGEKTSNPSIIFVGTWQGRKRGKFIFEVFINFILTHVPKATLYMVSDFCPEHPNVIDAKGLSDEELAKIYRKTWILAYPSLYEGFGIPYVEALASGTAIVSSPNIGAQDVLDDGKYGVLANDNNFAESIVNLLCNTNERKYFEQLGKDRAKLFAWENIASKHRKIYLTAIELRKAKKY